MAKVSAKGFRNFWGLEQLDGIYKQIKGDEEFGLEDKKLDKVRVQWGLIGRRHEGH